MKRTALKSKARVLYVLKGSIVTFNFHVALSKLAGVVRDGILYIS